MIIPPHFGCKFRGSIGVFSNLAFDGRKLVSTLLDKVLRPAPLGTQLDQSLI
jgi:hypothetical protein